MVTRIVSLSLLAVLTTACAAAAPSSGGAEGGKRWSSPPAMSIDPAKRYTATLKTAQGDVVIELLPKEAPQAVNNFVFLARQGYYQNVPIHRIVKGFVIQSGDPTVTGSGGPGYTIPDETVTLEYERGVVAMARTPAPNSAGSQFFITLANLSRQLPKQYVIFGRVTSGMEAVDAIAQTPVQANQGGELSEPTTPVTIQNVEIGES
jgi:peptidylprolyl isomerase